jgi:hypothetical protein
MARRKIATVVGVKGTVNVYRDSEWDEYVARFDNAKPGEGHHTGDKEDALSTAREMAGPEVSTVPPVVGGENLLVLGVATGLSVDNGTIGIITQSQKLDELRRQLPSGWTYGDLAEAWLVSRLEYVRQLKADRHSIVLPASEK